MPDAGSVLSESSSAAEDEAVRQWYELEWPPARQDAETAGGAIGAAAASAACVSAGAGLASPLCGAVGAWLGGVLGGLIYDLGSSLIDSFSGFAGKGSGHPFSHFANYAFRAGVELEIFDATVFDARKIFEYLDSIGIELRIVQQSSVYYYPDTYRQYGYENLRQAQLAAYQRGETMINPGERVMCPYYQGTVRIDGQLIFSNVCTESSYNQINHGDWWSLVARTMLARMAGAAASAKIVTRIDPHLADQIFVMRRPSAGKTLIVATGVATGLFVLWKVFA